MEVGYVVIQIRLADCGIGGEDVHDKGVEINGFETFGGVVKNGVVDIVNCCHKSIVHDGEDHLVCGPCLACGSIGGTQFLTFGCRGAGWDDWVGWRFDFWDVEASLLQAR